MAKKKPQYQQVRLGYDQYQQVVDRHKQTGLPIGFILTAAVDEWLTNHTGPLVVTLSKKED